jgi:predicted phosphodiesterase
VRALAVGGLGIGLVLSAGTAAVAGDLEKGPYLQNVTPGGVTIMWQVPRAAPGRIVVEGPGLPPGGRAIDVAPARIAETVIDGLRPAARYRYRVEVAGDLESGEFATAPEPGSEAPFSFVVIGDTRSNAENHRRVTERAMSEVPDFMVGTGDYVDEGSRSDQWQQFFDVGKGVLRDNVFYPAVGNHDRQGSGRTVDNYRQFFSLPENGGDPERYYMFAYGNARFLILDSNLYSFALTDQTAWIESQLADARQDPRVRHVFVVMHHPPFSISLHGGQRDLRERWTPLFEKYGVTAVFSGHDHCYERGEKHGVRYFVSGGGGAPLYPRGSRPSAIDLATIETFEKSLHYLRVTVQGEQVEVTGIRTDATIIETVTWGEPPHARAPAIAAAGAAAAPVLAARAADVGGATPGGIGWLGMGGAAAALLAAVVLVRALRR